MVSVFHVTFAHGLLTVSVILSEVDYTLMKESKEVLLSQRRKVDLQAKQLLKCPTVRCFGYAQHDKCLVV